MIVNGESFPSWFSPHYEPTEPTRPTEPERFETVETEIHIEDIFINSESPKSIFDKLSSLSQENLKILQHSMDFISIYRVEKTTIELSSNEYRKKIKSFEKKMIEYEKAYNEYLVKKRRYPELHSKYMKAFLEGELTKLENELDEKLIEQSYLNFCIDQIKFKIQNTKKELNDANSRNAII